jgi:regulator of Ty1 transposition protein 109
MVKSVADLRDTLLAALAHLPGTREFHLHVLVSSPRKHSDLFPYAHPRPRVYLQDVLVLLSETSPSQPRQLVSAAELSVYTIPSTSCGIVYVSKVDGTGQGIYPSPTSTLVKALLSYYVNSETRPLHVDTLWIQLFARAQNQYLFANSSDHPGKRPLSDRKLCVWWKRILSEVAAGVKPETKLRLYYVLPGYNELEAINSLHVASTSIHAGPSSQWIYGHPYSQSDIPLPCPPSHGVHNLGHYIPWFDDDPKSRFIDEIAHITDNDAVKSPERKRARTLSRTVSRDTVNGGDAPAEHATKDHKPEGELQKVSADEFWERMSFRQECVAGAVTGFFAMGLSSSAASQSAPSPSPLAPQPGQVAPNLVRRVVATLLNGHEFSTPERAARATETFEASIKGLCENISLHSSTEPTSAKSSVSVAPLLFLRETTPEAPSAPSLSATLEVPRTPPPKRGSQALPDVSPNPFPEPVASLETYHAHVYGTVAVANPPLAPRAGAVAGADATGGTTPAQPVTVLAVRKKKRKVE